MRVGFAPLGAAGHFAVDTSVAGVAFDVSPHFGSCLAQ